ncbi:MAG: VCBS repeat-containing protein, partial [Pseudomonadota bacterium]
MSFENLDLSGLDGTTGFRIDGAAEGDGLGAAISSAGDINNDGLSDLIIRAENTLAAYVFFGSGDAFDPTISISDLDGSNGFRIEGVNGPSPDSIRAAGDVNGDGIDDVIVGSAGSTVTGDEPEEAYVVFGQNGGFTAALDVSDLDGTNGFALLRFPGEFEATGANFGAAVSGIGDINADGIDDVIVGAEFVTFEDTAAIIGEAYVFFGSTDGVPATFDVAGLDGSNGFTLFGDLLDFSGSSLDGGGDVNGDGIADLIVNSPFPNCGVGAINVVFGSDQGFPERLSLADLDGTDGFTILGSDGCDVIGDSIRIVEDINGDGFDEILIGGPNVTFYSADGTTESFGAGEAYVVFGSDSGFDPLVSVDDLNGSNGFRLQSTVEGNELGISVSGAGDINGDGLGDIIVGSAAPAGVGGPLTGEAHVLFGSVDGFDPIIDIASIDGTLGFRVEGTPSDAPSSFRVSDAGDFNGDGLDDFLLGAPASDASGLEGSGASYVLFGAEPAAATLQVGLFDADTDQLLQPIKDGTQIQASLLEERNVTLVATVPDDSPLADQVEAVKLDLNDGQFTKTEKIEPYA